MLMQLKALVPALATYWLFIIALFSLGWFLLKNLQPNWNFGWKTAVTLALGVAVFQSYSMYHNLWVGSVLQSMQASQASNQPGQQPANPNDPNQMKGDFLRTVDALTAQPAQIAAVKEKLFSQFAPLFAKPEDRAAYARAITRVYECQRSFYEDALATKKSRRVVKSDDTQKCSKEDGSFFNRPHLIPDEVTANNEKVLESLASNKKPSKDQPAVDENSLRQASAEQTRRLDAVKLIFN